MQEIARVYADALFEAAKEHDKLDAIHEQLGQFADAMNEDREMQVFFFSPYFSSQEKRDGISKAVSGAEDEFVSFLELLAEKHRMPAIFRIRRSLEKLWQDENRLLPVSVTSAVPLDEGTVRQIGDRIAQQTGRRVDLTARVEPDILGGIIVRVGNSVLDASIRHRLEKLRRQVARAA